MDIKERAEALREVATPGSRIGLTELSRSNAWRKTLAERGLLEIVDRTDTAGYLVSVESLNEMLDAINALESEVERFTMQQMFIARGDKEQWKTGADLSQSAQDSLSKRKEKVRAFLDGGQ
ncbi:hypothetical protein [Bifidobacterium olomucense]|uniref:Uncharacterized protein n=1 Tax=Bifidobacterium olomucense TaxID=2675324 RepID=A0A7Y0EYI1_9BIFI|nr:hypothetical protein [Bifidobacterium sp. DSM 109959]NMM98488.1 hypothetical protein [Bifidobacterium sp. DSM 109959]